MRKIRIAADSSCDLFNLKHTEFACAPLKIITADQEFTDDPSLDVDAMTDHFAAYRGKSQSSCPNTADWLRAFGDADDVFCVTITSGLSGSYNAANTARQIYESEHEGRRVFVLDTLSAGPEITLVVKKLDEYIETGMAYEEICDAIKTYLQKTGLVFMLKSLKTLANNGRVSHITAKLVGMAGICIIGKASTEGTLEPMHKCRGERHSLEVLTETLAAEGFRSGKVSIGHCQNQPAAEQLKALILAKCSEAEVEIHRLGGLCSFYAEKGGVLVGFEKA
ncbi:MAG: DegV family protein [Clostridia bacterium]|nr:DegV family protein [Clostridia bacterium]